MTSTCFPKFKDHPSEKHFEDQDDELKVIGLEKDIGGGNENASGT